MRSVRAESRFEERARDSLVGVYLLAWLGYPNRKSELWEQKRSAQPAVKAKA